MDTPWQLVKTGCWSDSVSKQRLTGRNGCKNKANGLRNQPEYGRDRAKSQLINTGDNPRCH
jgi:hypothetical protein